MKAETIFDCRDLRRTVLVLEMPGIVKIGPSHRQEDWDVEASPDEIRFYISLMHQAS